MPGIAIRRSSQSRNVLHSGVWFLIVAVLWSLGGCGGGGSEGSNQSTTSSSTQESTSSTNTNTNSSSTTSSNGGTTSRTNSGIVVTAVGPGIVAASMGSNSDIAFSKDGTQYLSPVLTFDGTALTAMMGHRSNARTDKEQPVSLLLHLTGTHVGDGRVSFHSVTNPKGESLDLSIQPCVPQYCGVLVPRMPSMKMMEGTWSYRLQSPLAQPENFKVNATLRTGATPGEDTRLIIAPYWVQGTRFNINNVKAALAHLVAIYAKNGIAVTMRDLTLIDDSRFSVVSLDFTHPVTSELISQGATDAINLFFVDDFTDYGALGIAAAIPGSMGLAGGFNGILIGLSPHRVGSHVDTDFMGETAAHEMGHFLGLFHTSESTGSPQDPLEDTPECLGFRDVNASGSLELDECTGAGADNLMFWTPFTSWAGVHMGQDVLTPDQRTVIRHAPIAQ
ncbi:MAG: hypothetical protein HQL84_15025 [Magnetococcales bacterium]|nr:hypothetical protein [Magnetococcales bacterium]MBF0151332.1 hypothetical protein [Magnetococcales bacterium]